MWSKKFWSDAVERALSTAAQSALLVLGAGAMPGDIINADWKNVGGFALGGAILAMLKAVAASNVGAKDSASLVPSRLTTGQRSLTRRRVA